MRDNQTRENILRDEAVLNFLRDKPFTPIRTISAALKELYGPWCEWARHCQKMVVAGRLQGKNGQYREMPSWSVRQNNLRPSEADLGDQWRTVAFTDENCTDCPHASCDNENEMTCSYPIPVVVKNGYCYPMNVELGDVEATLEHSQHMRDVAEKIENDWRANQIVASRVRNDPEN